MKRGRFLKPPRFFIAKCAMPVNIFSLRGSLTAEGFGDGGKAVNNHLYIAKSFYDSYNFDIRVGSLISSGLPKAFETIASWRSCTAAGYCRHMESPGQSLEDSCESRWDRVFGGYSYGCG